jgi:hypothetical protein
MVNCFHAEGADWPANEKGQNVDFPNCRKEIFQVARSIALAFLGLATARAEDAQAPAGAPASAALIETIRGNTSRLKPEQIKTGNFEKGQCASMEGSFMVRSYSKWVYVVDPARHAKNVGGTQLHQFEKAADGTVAFKRDLPYPKELEGCSYNAMVNLFFMTLPNGNGIAYLSIWGWGGSSPLWWFNVDKSTGEWSAGDKTNAPLGAMTLSPDKKFLYISGENNLQGFSLDRETGAPTPLPAGPKTYGFNMVMSDDGKFAYTVEHDSSAETMKTIGGLQAAVKSKRDALKQTGRDLKKNPEDVDLKKKIEDLQGGMAALEKEMQEARKSDNWLVCVHDRDPATGMIGPARSRAVMTETQEPGLCSRRDSLHLVMAPNNKQLFVLWQDDKYDAHWSSYTRNTTDGTVQFDSTKGKNVVWYKQDLVVSPDKKNSFYATYWEGGGILGSFEWDDKEMYKNQQKIPSETSVIFQSVDLDTTTRTLYAVDMGLSKLLVFKVK